MAPGDVEAVHEALPRTSWLLESSESSDLPIHMQVIEDPDTAKTFLKLVDEPEDRDDVPRVASDFASSDTLMADLSSMV